MAEEKFCDICGCSEQELPKPNDNDEPKLTIDEDGLWICSDCRMNITTEPVGDGWEVELEDEIKALIGKSAWTICRALGLPYEPPYENVLDAAYKIGSAEDHTMSAWLFVNQWQDGSTVWRSKDSRGMVIVKPDGSIQINSDWFAD